MQKLSSLTLPWPTQWDVLFGTQRMLILEIGFGHGHFLFHLAQQHPDANIIGIEISNRCLLDVEEKLERKKLNNVRVIHATAETALNHLIEPATLSQVHINFPDPWFKSKHEHRRLMQRDTLDTIVSRMLPGTNFYLATDIIEYAEMSDELLRMTSGLDNLLDTPWASALPGRAITKYESKALEVGRPCAYFAYQRNNQPVANPPIIQEIAMPHMVFSSPLTLSEMLTAFKPIEHTEGNTHMSIMRGYSGERALLFECFVKERTIDQHFAITLLEREQSHEYTLQLSSLGHPRSTAGIHLATALLGEWLLNLHPDTQMVKRKIQEASQLS